MKHTFWLPLLAFFGFWIIYQLKQWTTSVNVNGDSFKIHLNNERISNMLGRKGLLNVKLSKLTNGVDSTMILDDVTNPGDVGFGFKEHQNRNDEKETTFDGVEGLESISTEVVLTKMKANNHGLSDTEDGAYGFLDENGIPEIDRDKFESTQTGNASRV